MSVDRKTLRDALASGPFSLALRVALQCSGLSLERVQARLRERDVSVSKTALSNWQSGRTQPERAESLRALAALEQVLGLPESALVRLVGSPRPRGRWVGQTPGDMPADQAWVRSDGLTRALAAMGARPDALNVLTRVAMHVTGEVDADRTMTSLRCQLVLRAVRDDVNRYTAAYRSDSPDGPVVSDALGCRLGRRRIDAESGFTLWELLLDRPLAKGELTTVDYTITPSSQDCYHAQRIGGSTGHYSIQIRFATLPVRAYHRYLSSVADLNRRRVETDLVIGASRTAQFGAVDPQPGIYRIAWEWE